MQRPDTCTITETCPTSIPLWEEQLKEKNPITVGRFLIQLGSADPGVLPAQAVPTEVIGTGLPHCLQWKRQNLRFWTGVENPELYRVFLKVEGMLLWNGKVLENSYVILRRAPRESPAGPGLALYRAKTVLSPALNIEILSVVLLEPVLGRSKSKSAFLLLFLLLYPANPQSPAFLKP